MTKNSRQNRSGEITEAISHFATSATSGAVSESALSIARLSMFDWLVVSVPGSQEPVSGVVREMVAAEGGVGESTVIGLNVKLPSRAAALANGTASHALDYDDTHFVYLGHPSVTVMPAAFAMAEKTGATAEAFLHAALIGVESACRIGAWLGRRHHLVGFHSTATVGCFGAAMAAARLLGLNETKARHALSLAATRASGLKAQFGTMGKPYHAGMAAANGVEVALLAEAGFEAEPEALECPQGFADTHGGEFDDPAKAMDGLGSTYLFEKVLHKYHACCHATHAALEALIDARDKYRLEPQGVRDVTVTIHPRYLKVCNIAEPAIGLEAKFSYRLLAALILSRRDTASLATFSDNICTDPGLIDLRNRVSVNTDASLSETAAVVRITPNMGSTIESNHDIDRPQRYGQREARVRAKGAAILGEKAAGRLWKVVQQPDPLSLALWLRENAGLSSGIGR